MNAASVMRTGAPRSARPVHWSILLLASPLLAIYLLLTDEGGSPVSSLFTVDGLFAMALYSWAPLLGLFLVAHLTRQMKSAVLKHAITLLLGIALGAALMIALAVIMPMFVQAILR
jgi:hypothetical protein